MFRERQGKKKETLPIFLEGKTRKEQRYKSHIHIGKDKKRTEKQKPYAYNICLTIIDTGCKKKVQNQQLFDKKTSANK